MRRRTVLLGATLALLPRVAAAAEALSFSSKGSDIVINFEKEVEWSTLNKVFIVRGNATATQDDTHLAADELLAHYRDKPSGRAAAEGAQQPDTGSIDIYRVDAVGNVTIKTKGETATGHVAVYDFDRKVLVLEGSPVTLKAADGTVTARKRLTYWSTENVAVAEGDAVALDTTAEGTGRRVSADKLTAFFRDAPANGKKPAATDGRDLIFLQGEGNVVLTTKSETVRGDRGNYNLQTGDVSVEGNVKMTKPLVATGAYATGNVKTSIKLHAAPQGRVRALVAPKSLNKDAPKPVEAPR